MPEVIQVEHRDSLGKRNSRRLRKNGRIPAVLYGHGQETVSLSISADEIQSAVEQGTRLVMLEGAVSDQAFVRETQWNTWGSHILHVDFTRVSAHEKVQVQVTIDLRGESPGVKNGGVIEHQTHHIDVECAVSDIPDKLSVSINQLNLGDSIHVRELDFPSSVTVLTDPTLLVVQCVEPVEEEEEEAKPSEVEPEVIGRKAAESEEEGS